MIGFEDIRLTGDFSYKQQAYQTVEVTEPIL
jgi:hypothetical protein